MLKAYLNQFKNQLTPGIAGGRKEGNYQWYEIQDNTAYYSEFEKPKIVYPDIAVSPQFAYDESGAYGGNTMYIVPTKEMWLLGLLNSKAVFWFYTKTSTKIRGGFVRFISQYVSQIPIPPIQPAQKVLIGGIVNQILAIKRANPAADVCELENQIDQIVTHYTISTMMKLELWKKRQMSESRIKWHIPLLSPDVSGIKSGGLHRLRGFLYLRQPAILYQHRIQTTNANLKYGDITDKSIGAGFDVHTFLGDGFQEVIYQRALALELSRAGLTFGREVEQDIFYKELPEPIGTRRADFVVEGKVLVELKAISKLEEVHIAQPLW